MAYPYQKRFVDYCKKERKLTDSSIVITEKSIQTFWNYYANGIDDASIDNVTETDLRNFLNSLETELNFKKNTINKYLSHLKVYFAYLYSRHLIKNYPILMINGRYWSRKHDVVINWMDKLPEIAKIDGLNPLTVKFMIGIYLGYEPKEVLHLRYKTAIHELKNDDLKQYLKVHCDFSHGDNPYIIAKKGGGAYASDFNLARKIEPDREVLGIPLTLQSLRLSYIYSYIADESKTDEEIRQILHINQKSLLYYRKNLLLYVNPIEFEL